MGLPKLPDVWTVTATRGRPDWITKQLGRLLPKLAGTERAVVVVDGDPETEAVLGALVNDRLRVVALSAQQGPNTARRLGIAMVPTDAVVCVIDDHDLAEPDLLSELRTAFVDPAVMLAFCDVYHTDPGGQVLKTREKPGGRLCTTWNQTWGMQAFRRWVYDMVGGYPDAMPAGDYELACRIEQLVNGTPEGIRHIRRPLVTVVQDHRGISGQRKAEQQARAEAIATQGLQKLFRLPFAVLDWPTVGAVVPVKAPKKTVAVPVTATEPDGDQPASLPRGTERRPHVTVVAETVGAGRGGGEMSMLAMLTRLHEAGMRVSAVFQRQPGPVPEWLELHPVPMYSDRILAPAIKGLEPDAVLCNINMPHYIYGPCGLKDSTPVLAHVQFWRRLVKMTPAGFEAIDHLPLDPAMIDIDAQSRLARLAGITANSDLSGEIVQAVTGKPALAVIYPTLSDVRTPDDAPPVHERPFILCLSAQVGKGSLVFLALARHNPDLQFLLYNDGAYKGAERVDRLAATVPNITVRHGWAADMSAVYAETRLVYMGTLTSETFSRVAAEARLNGIPILAHDVGNLRRIVTGDAGVRVPRRSSLGTWHLALGRALRLRPKPSTQWAQDHSARIVPVVNAVRRLSDVAVLVPNAPGVDQAVRHWHDVLGVTALPWKVGADVVREFPLVIIPGMGNAPDRAGARRTAILWCSGFAQMDSRRVEVARLVGVLKRTRQESDRWWLTTDQADARALQKCGMDRVRWLPLCFAPPGRPEMSRLGGRNVYLPGPYFVRKNVYAALVAVAACKATLHVTDWIKKADAFQELAGTLGVKVCVHPCTKHTDVLGLAAKCTVAIVSSLAETYCYGAAECVAMGTPVVHGRGVRCLGSAPDPLCVDDPTDTERLADALACALSDPQGHAAAQIAAVTAQAERHAAIARKVLLGVLDA